MTRRFLAIVALALFALAPFLSSRQQVPPALDAAIKAADAQLTTDFAADNIGGISVGIVSGQTLIWSKHYGFAESDSKRVATNDTAYRVGSITKQFTALALLQLVEAGKMRLTDPLEKYVPEIKQVKNAHGGTPPITLLQVATMTSGLAREPGCTNHSVGPVSGWEQKVIDCLPETQYANEPGTTYLYSNIGYASLGLAIGRAAGKPFTTVIADQILKPLGMTRSMLEPTADLRKDLAHGYVRQGTTGNRTGPDRELDGRGYRVPNGALFSTINDLTKFIAWELGEGPATILKKETQDANYARVGFSNPTMTSGYGVGFQVTRRGEVVILGHGGSTSGYLSAAMFHRPSKLGVMVFRNCDNCVVTPGPVANRMLEQMVIAARR